MVVAVSGVVVLEDCSSGFVIFPLIYPTSPLDPSNWVILIFHCNRFSPLNFCSSERIVNDGVPDDIAYRGM